MNAEETQRIRETVEPDLGDFRRLGTAIPSRIICVSTETNPGAAHFFRKGEVEKKDPPLFQNVIADVFSMVPATRSCETYRCL